jgi:hypothetical protein
VQPGEWSESVNRGGHRRHMESHSKPGGGILHAAQLGMYLATDCPQLAVPWLA